MALGAPAVLGDFQVQVFAGAPSEAGPPVGTAGSGPSAGGATPEAKDDGGQTESMGGLRFSAVGAPGQAPVPETAPEIEGYRILAPIGQGGMGTVWRAEQLSTHREVALKVMSARGTSRDKAQARFEREVELTARLDHPNIGRIYDSGLCQGTYYYAMELIDGMPLDRYVQRLTPSLREVLSLMKLVCQAVHYAHLHGVIHRDLKPSNIMVSHDGQPHVLDFGLARSFLHEEEAVTISLEGEVAGTPAYMAPEQALGHQDQIDTRTDVFSLGVILYQLLTGRPPHDLSGSVYDVLQRVIGGQMTRPRQASPSIDRELEALLLRALATDMASRYASAGELADDIDNYLSGEPLRARIPTTFYFLSRRVRKHWKQAAIIAAILAVVLGTVIGAYTRIVGERAVSRAQRQRLEGRLDEAAAKLQEADLKAMILGKDKKKAQAALDLLVDRYLAAEDKASQLNYQLGQRPATVPARGIGLQAGKSLGPAALVRTPHLPEQVISWTLEPQGHRDGVVKLTYSPDGKWLASAGRDGTVRFWEGQSGQLSGMIVDPNGSVADVKWSNDSKNLMLVKPTGVTCWWIWDSPTRTARPIPASSPPVPVLAAEPLAWSRRAGVPGADEVLGRWNIRLASPRETLCRAATCLSLAPDRHTLAWADADGAITLLEVESGLVRSAGVPSWCGPLHCVAFSPQGDLFATCSGAGTVCLWDAHRWQPLRKFQAATASAGESSGLCVFCWSPDGQTLALANGQAGAIEIVETQSGRVSRRLMGKDQQLTSVDWSADGGTLVAGTANGMLLVWDMGSVSSGTSRELAVGGSNVRAVLMNTDPLRAVTATSEGEVELWDVREGRLFKSLAGSAGAVRCLVLTRDEKTMVSMGADHELRLWDLQTGGLLRTLKSDPNHPRSKPWAFTAAAWSPEGRKLAAGASDGWIIVWDVGARYAPRSFEAHCGSVTSLDWSRDGRLLLAGGSDGTARAFDVKNGFRDYAVLLPLWGSLGAGVAISPEGDYRGPPQIEDHLVYVVQADKGYKTLTPTEFRIQHGWINEPWQVGLYRAGAEPMKRIYVKAAARGPFDGQTWDTAFSDLQDALSAAQPDTEIWVAAGVYRPDRGTGVRTASFRLKSGVRLFGGFSATETRVHERDPNRHETILSGDLKGNDGPDLSGNDENSYHVVRSEGVEPNTILDGFTIAGGHADGPSEEDYRVGGGLYGRACGMTLLNCTFASNSAKERGGAVDQGWGQRPMKVANCRFQSNVCRDRSGGAFCAIAASAEFRNCLFQRNSAGDRGAGLYLQDARAVVRGCLFRANTCKGTGGGISTTDRSLLSLTECTFVGNTAEAHCGAIYVGQGSRVSAARSQFIRNSAKGEGGALALDGCGHTASTIIHCLFAGNEATGYGGGVDATDSDATVVGCVFIDNGAAGGGGMSVYMDEKKRDSDVVVTNCTFVANRSPGPGGGFYNNMVASVLTNCILWQNSGQADSVESVQISTTPRAMRHCVVQGWSGKLGGPENSGQDPCFLDPNGPDGKTGTADDNLRLGPASPCRDSGDNSALVADSFDLDGDGDPNEPVPFDLDGRPRIQNGRVDIGAYESEPVVSGGRQ